MNRLWLNHRIWPEFPIISSNMLEEQMAKFLSSRLTLLNRKEGGREGEKEEERRKRKASKRAASENSEQQLTSSTFVLAYQVPSSRRYCYCC